VDQKYGGKRDGEWFPHENMTSALLYCWLLANPRVGYRPLQGLIDILNTPGVTEAGQQINQGAQFYIRKRFLEVPGVLTHKIKVDLTKTKSHDDDVVGRGKRGRQKQTIVFPITIKCVDLRDYVIRTLLDPTNSIELGPKALGPDGTVHSFAQSPFAQAPLKYSRLLSFIHTGPGCPQDGTCRPGCSHKPTKQEYLVGDCVLIVPEGRRAWGREQQAPLIFRIDELFYAQPGEHDPDYWKKKRGLGKPKPPLTMRGVLFKPEKQARPRLGKVCKNLVACTEVVEYPAARVANHTNVVTPRCQSILKRHRDPMDFSTWFCDSQESDDGGRDVPYRPALVSFTHLRWQRGQQFAWLDLFDDGCTDIHRSFTGVYGRIANSVGHARIFLIMLLPAGVNKYQAYRTVRTDLEDLARVLQYDDGLGLVQDVGGAVAHVVGDSVGQDDWCRHKGSNASLNCSKCWMQADKKKQREVDEGHRCVGSRKPTTHSAIGCDPVDDTRSSQKNREQTRRYGAAVRPE
jgi:hypothetical protein